ncbi:ABC transporter permease [Hathewaya limosa]|uniref:Peptide/nickel transport system permease protein n=2 Tax=Hathewaya limosa TaxID=1536 RepID=A0ABU0JTD6_HATLI|nr:peptide/nickel transport system permease protein [Hathewaya limosa]
MISPTVSQDTVHKMLKDIGYYDPIWIKYIKWLGRVLHGDFGYSIQYKLPVLTVINSRIWNTFLLSIVSFIISSSIAILLGVIAASKQNSIFDNITTVVSFIGLSIPTFFFGLLLVKWLSFDVNLLPTSGMSTLGEDYTGIKAIIDVVRHMVMPVIVLSITQVASLMRYTRSSMIDVLSQEYIRTARAKGLNKKLTIWKHGFRNSLISIVTILCMQLPSLFSGALITETIFIWPGIGRLNYEAVVNRDYPLIMGITMMLAILIVFSNLLADMLYAVIDPRIKINK